MDPDRVRAQLDRILASAAFAGAERASSFLRFVVLRALSARAGEIKESVIAIEALGRNPSFDSKSDPIVRVEARRLRDRLDSFYRKEGAGDQILISLPKGGYVPQFSERQEPACRRFMKMPVNFGFVRTSNHYHSRGVVAPADGHYGSWLHDRPLRH